MKTRLSGFVIVALVLFGVHTQAHAEKKFDLIPVAGIGETTPKTTFLFDETPYLYFKLPQSGTFAISSFWQDPTGGDHFSLFGPSSGDAAWFSLTNWNTAKQVGSWNVVAATFYSTGVSVTDSTEFSVASPEPLGVTLFVTGGLALASTLRRRKRLTLS